MMLKSLLFVSCATMVQLVSADTDPFNLKGNPKITTMLPVISPEWNSGKMGDFARDQLIANLPVHKWTKRLMTELGDSIPEYCYETRKSDDGIINNDAKNIDVYEITFDDSPQTLTLCWDKTNTEKLETMVDVLSAVPNNARSVWNTYAQFPGAGDGCLCYTTAYTGYSHGSNSVCYGSCATTCPNCFHHELCNALNSVGQADDKDCWAVSPAFGEAYSKDTKRIVNDTSFEYWSSLCKAVLYDVNVPGGLQNLVGPYGFDYASVKNQVEEVKFKELPGQLVANQTFFKNYPRMPMNLVDKNGGNTVVSQTTEAYGKPTNTAIGAYSNTLYNKPAAATTTASGFITQVKASSVPYPPGKTTTITSKTSPPVVSPTSEPDGTCEED